MKRAYQTGVVQALGAYGLEKAAEAGIVLGLPNSPLSVSASGKHERLPGMRRWVPRDAIERAGLGLDEGLDPQALLELEAQRGRFAWPAVGGALGAGGLRLMMPQSGLAAQAGAGLLGAGAGALAHRAGESARVSDMGEALRGVLYERLMQRSALTGQAPMSAAESTPLVVSRGEG